MYHIQKRHPTIGHDITRHCLPLDTSDCFSYTSDGFIHRKFVTSSIKPLSCKVDEVRTAENFSKIEEEHSESSSLSGDEGTSHELILYIDMRCAVLYVTVMDVQV